MISVIFPAAGKGTRTGLSFNKIFIDFLGKPLFIHTLERFSTFKEVDEMIIVASLNEIKLIKNILSNYKDLLPYKIVAGGETRQISVFNGLNAVSKESDIVLVHDMARPFVTETVFKNVVNGVKEKGAVVCAIPVSDTIKVVENDVILNTPKRSTLKAIQTPQGFKKDLLIKAYEICNKDGFVGTDDASLLEYARQKVFTVLGDPSNIKITSNTDLLFAKTLFMSQKNEN